MASEQELRELVDRIAAGRQTRQDMTQLTRLIRLRGSDNVVLNGRYNVQMRDGQNIHFGDVNYHGYGADNIRRAIRQALDARGDHHIGPLRGVSGLLITVGILVGLVGFFLFVTEGFAEMGSFDGRLPSGPPMGFLIALGGVALGIVGQLMQGWEQGRRR
jgi:hypothetical protein